MSRIARWWQKFRAVRAKNRYERLKSRVTNLRDRVVRDLERELEETRVALKEALIDNRMLKRVIEQQEYVINRDRHRVMQEIRDLGGTPDTQPAESDGT